jgi:uncharacterized membrane protein YhaH (DUF805 family)
MSENNNPYTTPEAAVAVDDDATYEPKFLSISGRIGRLRYFAYVFSSTILLNLLALALLLAVSSTVGEDAGIATILTVILYYIGPAIPAFIFAIRRLNDLDKTGWLSILFIIPLINLLLGLYLLFAGGTKGSNSYGPAPAPNTLGVKIVALLLPIAIIGILAAIALPAYNDYVEKAEAQMMLEQ